MSWARCRRTSFTTLSCVLTTMPSSSVCCVKSTLTVSFAWIFSIARSSCVLMTRQLRSSTNVQLQKCRSQGWQYRKMCRQRKDVKMEEGGLWRKVQDYIDQNNKMIAMQIWPRIELQGTSDFYEYAHDIRRVTRSNKRCLRKIGQPLSHLL